MLLSFFQSLQVPLSVVITWIYAFFLTAGGAYDYKGCSPDIPSSNILTNACIKHAYTMKHCRTDVSNAWRTAAWVRIPYPLQWGIPIFHLGTSMIMIIVSLVASVDSVSSLLFKCIRIYDRIYSIIIMKIFCLGRICPPNYPTGSQSVWSLTEKNLFICMVLRKQNDNRVAKFYLLIFKNFNF